MLKGEEKAFRICHFVRPVFCIWLVNKLLIFFQQNKYLSVSFKGRKWFNLLAELSCPQKRLRRKDIWPSEMSKGCLKTVHLTDSASFAALTGPDGPPKQPKLPAYRKKRAGVSDTKFDNICDSTGVEGFSWISHLLLLSRDSLFRICKKVDKTAKPSGFARADSKFSYLQEIWRHTLSFTLRSFNG